jgi:hypothetical protein
MLWDHCIFCWWKKEGRIWFNTIYLKLYQFERITWWCVYILESTMESIMLEKILKRVMISQKLRQILNKNSGRPWNLIHSLPCKTPCRLFTHEVFFEPLGFHLRVWSELEQFTPFRPMRALRLQRSWGFSLVCDGALSVIWVLLTSDQSESIQRIICGWI